MSDTSGPPFRADHVGSLLRPHTLLDARARHAAGEIDNAELRGIEDDGSATSCACSATSGWARHRRGVPPGVLAHGLHLRDRRLQMWPSRAWSCTSRTPTARSTSLRRGCTSTVRSIDEPIFDGTSVPAVGRRAGAGRADHSLPVDGPLPRRGGGIDPKVYPTRLVLGAPSAAYGLEIGGMPRRAVLPAARRHEPGLPQRPRAAGRDRRPGPRRQSPATSAASARSTRRSPAGRRG